MKNDKSIIVVSASEKERLLLKAELELCGFWSAVFIAENKDTVFHLLTSSSVHLVIFDMINNVPKSSEILSRLENELNIPVLKIADADEMSESKANSITVPFDFQDFLDKVKRFILPAGEVDLEKIRTKISFEEEELRYKDLFERASDILLLLDFDTHTIIDANQQAVKAYGYSHDELIGMNLLHLIPREQHLKVLENTIKMNKENIVLYSRDRIHQKKDGSQICVSVSATCIEYGGRKVFQDIVRNETDRIHYERQLKKLNLELNEANEKLLQENIKLEKTQQELERRKEELENYQNHLEKLVNERTESLNIVNKELKQEIKERKNAEKELLNSLRDKEVLIRELYHRTKNNMQVIISMMQLHRYRSKDKELTTFIDDMEKRIYSMSLVHQKLYESENLSMIRFNEYIKDLIQHYKVSFKTKERNISFALDLAAVNVLIDTAIPCGIVINELIVNALKYAFPDHQPGEIRIALEEKPGNMIQLTISDNGVGLKDDLEIDSISNLGLKTVLNIVKHQLQGEFLIEKNNGLSFFITLENIIHNPRV